MPKYSYRLWIPAEVTVSHRDTKSDAKVESAMRKWQDFDDLAKAELKAIETINGGGSWSTLHDFKIERLPDGMIVRDYEALKNLADAAKKKAANA